MSAVLDKAIRLIDLVAQGHDSLAALARQSGLSRSTTHRLLATLVDLNYLGLHSRRYALGYRLLELGEQKKRSLRFADAVRDIMSRYAAMTGDTIHVAVLDGRDIVLVERVAGARQLQIDSYAGQRARAGITAVGKALISTQNPETWEAYLESLPAGYRKTKRALLQELRIARLHGFALDYDECDVGTCGIAASFRVNDHLLAACSVNGATVYFSEGRMIELAAIVQQMASDMQLSTVGQAKPFLVPEAAALAAIVHPLVAGEADTPAQKTARR